MTTTGHGVGSDTRHWLLRVGLGGATALIGILVLAWPQRTLLAIAVLFGIELVILGVVRLAALVMVPMDQPFKWMTLVLGLLTVLAGIFCFFRPSASLVVLAVFFAAGFISDGVADLARVRTVGASGSARTVVVASGVASIAAGIVVALFPTTSLVLLMRVAGIVLLAVGVVQVLRGLSARQDPKVAAAL